MPGDFMPVQTFIFNSFKFITDS
jgi:hypothetical protein